MSDRRLSCAFFVTAVAIVMSLLTALAAARPFDESGFKAMKWRLVGPFRGGRVSAVTGIPGDPSTFYFGGAGGGVWRTTDGGQSWTSLTDEQPLASVGSIAVAESDPSVIYVGTGEASIRDHVSYGNGVYKSTDSGKTWSYIGLRDTQHIAKVLVHPRNPDLVYVAALGHAYGPNPERGVYRSSDRGKTWEKVLFKDDNTGAVDLVFDPRNPSVMFAALYEVQRTPWSMSSGGPGSGLYRSTDEGKTWKQLEGKGLPTGVLGRIGISVSGADSKRVYALIEARDGGLFRSDDGGDAWTRISQDQRLMQCAWCLTHVFADPKRADTVYILSTDLFRSTDGGKSLTLLPAPHDGHHGLWIDPTNPQRIINGNDGGATITADGGKTWSTQYNQPTAQFYHVAADNRFLYYLYGAQRDNSRVAIASRTDDGYIGRQHWYEVGSGEGDYVVPDPRDPNLVYAGSGGGHISRFDVRARETKEIAVWPTEGGPGRAASDPQYRQAWNLPIIMSPHNPDVLYTAAQVVFKSPDRGMSWTAIGPDLTRNDKSKQPRSDGPITKGKSAVESYDTVSTIAESPVEKDVIWAGTDDGLIQVSRDGGQHWDNVTPKDLPEWSLISMIGASPLDAGKAFVAVDAHKLDDLKPYIYKTKDYGQTWTQITDGIPDGAYVHVVREDPERKGLLYAGTEMGVYVSFDGGAQWRSLQLNLPLAPIYDLILKDNDLVAATDGRAFWVLDDIAPLRHLGPRYSEAVMVLHNPSPAYRLRWPEQNERRQPVASNPPAGAILYYAFNPAPTLRVSLEILDSDGNMIRTYSDAEKEGSETPPKRPDLEPPQENLPTEAGLNRFIWNLRYEGPRELPGEVGTKLRNRGPLALPGEYTVRLKLGASPLTAPMEVKPDPRVKVPLSDLTKRFDLSLKVRDQLSELHQTVDEIRKVREQLRDSKGRSGNEARFQGILSAADALDKKMTPVEEQLLQVKIKSSEASMNHPVSIDERLHALFFSVESGDTVPTAQQYTAFDELSRQAAPLIAQWKQIMSTDLVALNGMLQKEGVPAISIAPPGQPPAHAEDRD